MNNNSRRITVIATLIQRTPHYIKSTSRRQDGWFTVETTSNLKEAKEFESRVGAEKVKEKIFNPYERTYAVEETHVDWPKRTVESLPGEFQ